METSKAEGKRRLKEMEEEEEEEEDDSGGGEYTSGGFGLGLGEDEEKKKKGKRGMSGSYTCCQAENCSADMADAKPYHRRHKVCEFHAKASIVAVAGLQQRFCQQCSRFHEVSEFDEAKRSCRRRLAGHNERRRKSSYDQYHGEGSI